MTRSEACANTAMQSTAAERARWAAVLAKPAVRAPRKPTQRKGLIARLLGL